MAFKLGMTVDLCMAYNAHANDLDLDTEEFFLSHYLHK